MALIYLCVLFLFLFAAKVNAGSRSSIAPRQDGNVPDNHTLTGWTNEAIFTLVGVCVAVAGILIGLASSPKLRQWVCKPFKSSDIKLPTDFSRTRRIERSRKRMDARRQLQDEYNEYLRFNDFLELRGGITSSMSSYHGSATLTHAHFHPSNYTASHKTLILSQQSQQSTQRTARALNTSSNTTFTKTNTTSNIMPFPTSAAPTAHSHIQFGATPHRASVPRHPSSYKHSVHSTRSNQSTHSTQPAASPTQNMTRSSSSTKPTQNFTDILSHQQLKSMSDLDKEEEARLAKTHRAKAVKMGVGICRWVGKLASTKGKNGGGDKKGEVVK
ncbi:hypothetical protein BKA58DRAFT_458282 [Alternaria rosae]|uniref:uncharacterized protein n=1 Tax=Alternaria rosae TaxID=1187941 RepID=UPI001E8E4A49|nr:uncharacterized protein BKA58DRAFT_458282 [Alternaria rosae]KAH6870712.1 hypothetical protein BKA58DRAFT_458282 [Alternaria rosae]